MCKNAGGSLDETTLLSIEEKIMLLSLEDKRYLEGYIDRILSELQQEPIVRD